MQFIKLNKLASPLLYSCLAILLIVMACSKSEPPISNDDEIGVEDPMDNDSTPEDPPADDPPADDPPAEPSSILKLNSGGMDVTFGDQTYILDDYFMDGDLYTNENVTAIEGTENDEIYLTERSAGTDLGSFSYAIPLTNGMYTIDLHFAEIYWGATGGGPGGVGQRIFNVAIEGEEALANYDIIEDAGAAMTAIVKTFTVEINDEELNIDFTAVKDQPKLSALEIIGDGMLLPKPPDPCAPNALASSSLAKVESQSAKVNGKLYVLAGFVENLKITDVTEIYDPMTNQWSLGAPMPLAVTHMGSVVVDNAIWIVGGFSGDHPGVATDRVQIYNTLSDSWEDGPSLPNPRGSGAAVYNNGKIHFFGGLLPDRRTDVGEHLVLDLANMNDGWQSAADMPDPRNHHSGASVNGLVYAIGGQFGHDGGTEDQNFLDVYDPSSDTWERLANLPSDRSHFEPGTIVHNDKIIIVGGRNGNFFFDDITIYDPATDQWTEDCKLSKKLLAPSAKIFGNQLIIANGGENGTCCPLDIVEWITIDP